MSQVTGILPVCGPRALKALTNEHWPKLRIKLEALTTDDIATLRRQGHDHAMLEGPIKRRKFAPIPCLVKCDILDTQNTAKRLLARYESRGKILPQQIDGTDKRHLSLVLDESFEIDYARESFRVLVRPAPGKSIEWRQYDDCELVLSISFADEWATHSLARCINSPAYAAGARLPADLELFASWTGLPQLPTGGLPTVAFSKSEGSDQTFQPFHLQSYKLFVDMSWELFKDHKHTIAQRYAKACRSLLDEDSCNASKVSSQENPDVKDQHVPKVGFLILTADQKFLMLMNGFSCGLCKDKKTLSNMFSLTRHLNLVHQKYVTWNYTKQTSPSKLKSLGLDYLIKVKPVEDVANENRTRNGFLRTRSAHSKPVPPRERRRAADQIQQDERRSMSSKRNGDLLSTSHKGVSQRDVFNSGAATTNKRKRVTEARDLVKQKKADNRKPSRISADDVAFEHEESTIDEPLSTSKPTEVSKVKQRNTVSRKFAPNSESSVGFFRTAAFRPMATDESASDSEDDVDGDWRMPKMRQEAQRSRWTEKRIELLAMWNGHVTEFNRWEGLTSALVEKRVLERFMKKQKYYLAIRGLTEEFESWLESKDELGKLDESTRTLWYKTIKRTLPPAYLAPVDWPKWIEEAHRDGDFSSDEDWSLALMALREYEKENGLDVQGDERRAYNTRRSIRDRPSNSSHDVQMLDATDPHADSRQISKAESKDRDKKPVKGCPCGKIPDGSWRVQRCSNSTCIRQNETYHLKCLGMNKVDRTWICDHCKNKDTLVGC